MKETLHILSKLFDMAGLTLAERHAVVAGLSDEELSTFADEMRSVVESCANETQAAIDRFAKRKPGVVKRAEQNLKPKGGRRVGS